MLFKRRKNPGAWQRFLNLLWPKRGWTRAVRYLLHRVARLPDTPHSVAAGVASGMAVSFTPFLGLHFILGFALAYIVRGNLFASAIGTAVGNPWTFPLIFASAAQIGSFMLGRDVLADVPDWSWDVLVANPYDYITSFVPLVWPLVIGGTILGAFVWVLAYFLIKATLERYKRGRAERLARKQSRS
jgi:uncharacterized protein (DUF2062 family)